MRRITTIFAMLFCGLLYCYAQQPEAINTESKAHGEEKVARLTFDKTNHDFGTLKFKGEPVTYDFSFTNTGTAPLVIIRTETSCRCLTVKSPKKPVAAGESGVISVTYTPDTYTGRFYNSIDVFSNGADRMLTLFVEGETIK